MTQTDTNPRDWSELKRLRTVKEEKMPSLATLGDMGGWLWDNLDAVLELIAEVERLRANAEKMEKLYRGLSVERGDLQAEFIEMRSERDALKSQRDEMAEALGWIEAQAKAFAQSKMSEQTRSGIRASAWNWVFAVEQKVADIQRRARSSLNKEKTGG